MIESTTTAMELRDVSLATGGVLRVDRITRNVTRGRLLAIVGDNGSGKSSLLSLMAGHISPSSGQVLVNGQPVSSISPVDRARHLAWLGQTTAGADSYAVRDVVAWGRIAHSGDTAICSPEPADIIDQLGLSHLAHAPLGSLSGGERQRVHIARVWVQSAQVTLLDEPDASLDESGRFLLRRLIAERVETGCTIVVITHDRGWAAGAADEMWLMAAGRLTVA